MVKNKVLKTLLIPLCLFISLSIEAVEADFLTIYPEKGDGILSILRRYYLLDSKCDVKKFYKLNGLNKSSKLISGKKYKLPIFVFEYNSTSIRSTIGIDDWDKAIRIKDYNKLLYRAKVKKTKFTQGKKILWVPYREIYCDEVVNMKPVNEGVVKGKKGEFPIFGPKYKNTPIKSNKLKGQVFYIVSGHGGIDPGAIGKYGKYKICEDEYAYDISLRLCRKLVQHGAVAYMITRDLNDGIRSGEILPCDTDEKTWKKQSIFQKQKPRLLQRSNAVNRLYERNKLAGAKEQYMLCIHIDSRIESKRADVFFYYHSSSKMGKAIALKMQAKLKEKYKRKYTGTVSSRDLHMLRETKPTSIYIELGNIKNPSDQKRFTLESNRELLSKWLFEGIHNFAP